MTGDLRQSGQAEEMWALTRSRLSIVTWRSPEPDPVVAWGQVFAYLPEIRRLIVAHGHSIVLLPRARLTIDQVAKANDELGAIASQEGRSLAEVRREAEQGVREGLDARGELERFEATLAVPGNRRGLTSS